MKNVIFFHSILFLQIIVLSVKEETNSKWSLSQTIKNSIYDRKFIIGGLSVLPIAIKVSHNIYSTKNLFSTKKDLLFLLTSPLSMILFTAINLKKIKNLKNTINLLRNKNSERKEPVDIQTYWHLFTLEDKDQELIINNINPDTLQKILNNHNITPEKTWALIQQIEQESLKEEILAGLNWHKREAIFNNQENWFRLSQVISKDNFKNFIRIFNTSKSVIGIIGLMTDKELAGEILQGLSRHKILAIFNNEDNWSALSKIISNKNLANFIQRFNENDINPESVIGIIRYMEDKKLAEEILQGVNRDKKVAIFNNGDNWSALSRIISKDTIENFIRILNENDITSESIVGIIQYMEDKELVRNIFEPLNRDKQVAIFNNEESWTPLSKIISKDNFKNFIQRFNENNITSKSVIGIIRYMEDKELAGKILQGLNRKKQVEIFNNKDNWTPLSKIISNKNLANFIRIFNENDINSQSVFEIIRYIQDKELIRNIFEPLNREKQVAIFNNEKSWTPLSKIISKDNFENFIQIFNDNGITSKKVFEIITHIQDKKLQATILQGLNPDKIVAIFNNKDNWLQLGWKISKDTIENFIRIFNEDYINSQSVFEIIQYMPDKELAGEILQMLDRDKQVAIFNNEANWFRLRAIIPKKTIANCIQILKDNGITEGRLTEITRYFD